MQSKIQQFLQECRELEGIGQNPGSSRSGVKTREQKISRDSIVPTRFGFPLIFSQPTKSLALLVRGTHFFLPATNFDGVYCEQK